MGWTSRVFGCLIIAVCVVSCAKIPSDRYGVSSLHLEGVDELDDGALRACLATRERDSFAINIGHTAHPDCGIPPFDAGRVHVRLWKWPWAEWPLYDRVVLERDFQRILRWYRARGFYDAKIASHHVFPAEAERTDRVTQQTACDRPSKKQGCRVRVEIVIHEGTPVHVQSVDLTGDESLPPKLQKKLRDAITLEVGDRFDEAEYDRSKQAIQGQLAEHSFARAIVKGRVDVDPTKKTARIAYQIAPGPVCILGTVRLEGNKSLPASTILAAAALAPGDRYKQSAIDDAQQAIYDLGAFASVEVLPQLGTDPHNRVIPVIIRVTIGRLARFGLGLGMLSGTVETLEGSEQIDIPQWDVHLLAVAEHRNLFGGLRRLRVEDRPRLIFDQTFPRVRSGDPTIGNVALLEFRQPAFLEHRTTLLASARWDLGPDPFRGFLRHDLDARIAPGRNFFHSRLFASMGLHGNLLFVIAKRNPFDSVPSNNHVLFLEQQFRLDLRDNPNRPRRGAFFGMNIHEAGFFLPSSWNYFRLTPDARLYFPLPLGMVVATRFAMGALFITQADGTLDEDSKKLGPQRYRLRGGGASSNRGFLPGELGDGELGGIRRWNASLEFRVPITEDFGAVLFGDMGDVHQGKSFRFDYLQTSVGLGFRYRTIVGPLRLDFGWRVPRLQVIGGPDNVLPERSIVNLYAFRFPGAVHFTIGESF